MRVLCLAVALCMLLPAWALHTTKHLLDMDWSDLPESGNYTCEELKRWIGKEKHYSNHNRDVLFALDEGDPQCSKLPVLQMHEVSYGKALQAKRDAKDGYFKNTRSSAGALGTPCAQEDNNVVAYLSNFSINNNFSHFLHGLLRLFCALVDARWIVWNESKQMFERPVDYAIWLDEYFKLDEARSQWLRALGPKVFHLGKDRQRNGCANARTVIYGSGCVKLMPPEKWFGYPGCRAGTVLPAFGQYMRQVFKAPGIKDLFLIDRYANNVELKKKGIEVGAGERVDGIRVAFAQRDVGAETGKRHISNLDATQVLLQQTQHILTKTENITFEHFDVPSTVRYMASVHVFVSVHGAGMTNMFFMNPGSAVVEIIPYPLCNCKSPDYFYGVGGYYHGSAVAANIRHYPYCVEDKDVVWHKKPQDIKEGSRCSWKHLHAVESVALDPTRFVSLMRSVERDLIQAGTVVLTQPIIRMSPHANG